VLAQMEREAHARGCRDALIETLDDLTAQWYQRLGYAPAAVIACVGPFRRHTLLKRLAA
jgi:hypothetical protein